ncbi:MAG: flavodoxin domain-containing protein [Candidatus Thorarchaeota archaeon]
MPKKVLIAYGTRFGSTEEVSLKFKQTLEENGFIVDLVNLRAKKKANPTITEYFAVLIGSGIRITRWTKEAKKFLENNVKAINEKKILTGVFLCSGEASNPEKRSEVIEKYLVDVFTEFGLNLGENVLYDAFGGVFDLSKTSNLNWMNKRMLKMAANEDPNIVLNERKDYRDWDQINAFLDTFMRRLG